MIEDGKVVVDTGASKGPELIPASRAPAAEAPPRGRGRPAGAKRPAAATVTASPGSTPKPAPATDRKQLADQLQGLHQLLALASGDDVWILDPPEAKNLADAAASVCDEYGLSLSGKTGALLQLVAAASVIYAPRVILIARRKRGDLARVVNPADVSRPGGNEHAPAA